MPEGVPYRMPQRMLEDVPESLPHIQPYARCSYHLGMLFLECSGDQQNVFKRCIFLTEKSVRSPTERIEAQAKGLLQWPGGPPALGVQPACYTGAHACGGCPELFGTWEGWDFGSLRHPVVLNMGAIWHARIWTCFLFNYNLYLGRHSLILT